VRDGDPLVTTPRYCGMPHRATDGLPLAHRCRVLPVEAIRAEVRGEFQLSMRLFSAHAAAGRLEPHPGVWRIRRR
jgi:hypothetical protein